MPKWNPKWNPIEAQKGAGKGPEKRLIIGQTDFTDSRDPAGGAGADTRGRQRLAALEQDQCRKVRSVSTP
jgi:hypothetical protein